MALREKDKNKRQTRLRPIRVTQLQLVQTLSNRVSRVTQTQDEQTELRSPLVDVFPVHYKSLLLDCNFGVIPNETIHTKFFTRLPHTGLGKPTANYLLQQEGVIHSLLMGK